MLRVVVWSLFVFVVVGCTTVDNSTDGRVVPGPPTVDAGVDTYDVDLDAMITDAGDSSVTTDAALADVADAGADVSSADVALVDQCTDDPFASPDADDILSAVARGWMDCSTETSRNQPICLRVELSGALGELPYGCLNCVGSYIECVASDQECIEICERAPNSAACTMCRIAPGSDCEADYRSCSGHIPWYAESECEIRESDKELWRSCASEPVRDFPSCVVDRWRDIALNNSCDYCIQWHAQCIADHAPSCIGRPAGELITFECAQQWEAAPCDELIDRCAGAHPR